MHPPHDHLQSLALNLFAVCVWLNFCQHFKQPVSSINFDACAPDLLSAAAITTTKALGASALQRRFHTPTRLFSHSAVLLYCAITDIGSARGTSVCRAGAPLAFDCTSTSHSSFVPTHPSFSSLSHATTAFVFAWTQPRRRLLQRTATHPHATQQTRAWLRP